MKQFAINVVNKDGTKMFREFESIKILTQFKRRLPASSKVVSKFVNVDGKYLRYVVFGTAIITENEVLRLSDEIAHLDPNVWGADQLTLGKGFASSGKSAKKVKKPVGVKKADKKVAGKASKVAKKRMSKSQKKTILHEKKS